MIVQLFTGGTVLLVNRDGDDVCSDIARIDDSVKPDELPVGTTVAVGSNVPEPLSLGENTALTFRINEKVPQIKSKCPLDPQFGLGITLVNW